MTNSPHLWQEWWILQENIIPLVDNAIRNKFSSPSLLSCKIPKAFGQENTWLIYSWQPQKNVPEQFGVKIFKAKNLFVFLYESMSAFLENLHSSVLCHWKAAIWEQEGVVNGDEENMTQKGNARLGSLCFLG